LFWSVFSIYFQALKLQEQIAEKKNQKCKDKGKGSVIFLVDSFSGKSFSGLGPEKLTTC
jgi:hypothetical protein